jgi:hypothetical protein
MPTKYLLSLIFLVASQGTLAAGARPPVEVADPHPSYKIFTQSPEELICWAAAAKSVLRMDPHRNRDSVCEIVSKIRNQNCCLPGDGIVMSRFKNEERQGHVNTIYKAEKLDDGSYRFYVGDSGPYRWFRFLSRDVKRLRDGRWSYVSLNENFTIERFVTVLPQ